MLKLSPQKEGLKRCSHCKEVQNTQRFNRCASKRDGLKDYCRTCQRKSSLEYYNRKRRGEWARIREIRVANGSYQKSKERYNARYREVVTELFNLLGNKCALCGEVDRRLLQIDHVDGSGRIDRRVNRGGLSSFLKKLEHVRSGGGNLRLLCANHNLLEAIESGYKKSVWHEYAKQII